MNALIDGKRLGRQYEAVLKVMLECNGEYKTLKEIEEATGYPQASISARLRDFRQEKFGAWQVDRRRKTKTGGTWEYKVTKNPFESGVLF